MFCRIPGYDTFTGDRRVWTTPVRKEFVCFALDRSRMKGVGFRGTTLPEVKAAADLFAQKQEFPNGEKI